MSKKRLSLRNCYDVSLLLFLQRFAFPQLVGFVDVMADQGVRPRPAQLLAQIAMHICPSQDLSNPCPQLGGT